MRRWVLVACKRGSHIWKPRITSLSDGERYDFGLKHGCAARRWQGNFHPPIVRQQINPHARIGSKDLASERSFLRKGQLDLGSAPPFQDLLSEAARYAINDVPSLDFESYVASSKGQGTRLVEDPRFQFDFELWAILLNYRMRVYGDAGIKMIWRSLTRRDRVRLLPAKWLTEDSLWTIFIGLGLRDHGFLECIGHHAKQIWQERELRRPSLYAEVIGGLLEGDDPASASTFSKYMHLGASISSEDLLVLFLRACTSKNPTALEQFRIIYVEAPGHKLYGGVIPALCEQNRISEAMTMHRFLLSHGDCPSTFEKVEPLVRQLAKYDLDMSAFTRHLEKVGIFFNGRIRRLYEETKRSNFGRLQEDIDLATSRTFGVRRSKVSDAFAARFFATKSFSFHFALNGLLLLGLNELGPLSLREIAMQSKTASVLRQRLAEIESVGIDTGASAFSRVIRTLLQENDTALLSDIVRSDQHPDVFEDLQVQLHLLTAYHRAKNWRQVNRTLAILTTGGSSLLGGANALLRSALTRYDWPEIQGIAARMQQEGIQISRANINRTHELDTLPAPASEQANLNANGFNDLTFLITLWQNCLRAGTNIPPNSWREPLHRLGMMSRWQDLERTCLWLGSFYSSSASEHLVNASNASRSILPLENSMARDTPHSAVDEIFTPALQRSIVDWGFLAGWNLRGKPNHHSTGPTACVSGIRLLRFMQKTYGLHLHKVAIRAACEQRLRQLFSKWNRTESKHIREAERDNKAHLSAYIWLINKAYGQALFPEDASQVLLNIFVTRRERERESQQLPPQLTKSAGKGRNGAREEASSGTSHIPVCSENDFVMYRDLFHASWEDYGEGKQN